MPLTFQLSVLWGCQIILEMCFEHKRILPAWQGVALSVSEMAFQSDKRPGAATDVMARFKTGQCSKNSREVDKLDHPILFIFT